MFSEAASEAKAEEEKPKAREFHPNVFDNYDASTG